MKKHRVLFLVIAVAFVLCSCNAKNNSAETTSDESTDSLGAFGDGYTFDTHYAQTPDSFFYVKDSVVRLNKADFSDKTTLATKAEFGVGEGADLSAQIVGITSKWIFLSVYIAWNSESNTPKQKVFKLPLEGGDPEKVLEDVESAYLHCGNGMLYYTERDGKNTLCLYYLNLNDNSKVTVPMVEHELSGYRFVPLKDGKISFSGVVIDNENNVEIREATESEERTEDLGRDPSLEQWVEGLLDDGATLASYAEYSGYIYFTQVLNYKYVLYRVDKNGENKTLIDESGQFVELLSYNGVLYADLWENDQARLVKLDKDGKIAPTDAVTRGAGQAGHIKIEGGLFIRSYGIPNSYSLVYVYNPDTGDTVLP